MPSDQHRDGAAFLSCGRLRRSWAATGKIRDDVELSDVETIGSRPMTRSGFAMGSISFVAVIAAGILSARYVDRHFATAAGKERVSNSQQEAPSPQPSTSSGACV